MRPQPRLPVPKAIIIVPCRYSRFASYRMVWQLAIILAIGFLMHPVSATSINYADNPNFPIGWQGYWQNDTYMTVSDTIWANSSSQWEFINRVNFYVNSRITYKYNRSEWGIKSPNLTWSTGTGACGELALLKLAMLTQHGVNAHVVWGFIPTGEGHYTVELSDYGTIIDYKTIPIYIKRGDGIEYQNYIIS